MLDLFPTSQFVDCSYICIFIAAYIQIIRPAEGKTGGEVSGEGRFLREPQTLCNSSTSKRKVQKLTQALLLHEADLKQEVKTSYSRTVDVAVCGDKVMML